jgi:hypothetical protein
MLIGAHSVIYSTNPDADRAFLRDVIKLTNVDAGGGYVISGCHRRKLPCTSTTKTMYTSFT